MTDWGILPEAVRQRLRQLEWDNVSNLRDRLLGKRPFPIRVPLKPPTGRQALDAMTHFQSYIAAWRNWPGPGRVEYQTSDLQQVGHHELPTVFVLDRFDELAAFLGPHALARQRYWESIFEPLRAKNSALYPSLIRNLSSLESITPQDASQLADVLSQLKPGLGRIQYLRALPLTGVDTKFVEQHSSLLMELADALHDGTVSIAGSLAGWLECRELPRDWLFVRPLCDQCREALGGFDVMQLSTSSLLSTSLPGRRILIVENMAPGYSLPSIPDTVAVFGGGANVNWTSAPWLAERLIGYWGDIDTWGLNFLAEVRCAQPHVQALLMDQATIEAHQSRVVDVNEPNPSIPNGLTADEVNLYQDLLKRRYGGSCLEQERISADWLRDGMDRWVNSTLRRPT